MRAEKRRNRESGGLSILNLQPHNTFLSDCK